MPSISVKMFGGMKPTIHTPNTRESVAQIAHNVILRDTAVRSHPTDRRLPESEIAWRLRPAPSGRDVELYRPQDTAECCGEVATIGVCSTVVESQLSASCGDVGHILFTRDGCDPEWVDWCAQTTRPVVVPQPIRCAVAVLTDAGTMQSLPIADYRSPDERSYTYTWVDGFSVESPPAPPTISVPSYDDQTYTISGFDTPPPNAACLRLYRSVAFPSEGDVQDIPAQATFQLVAEIPAGTAVFVDDLRLNDILAGTLQTTYNCPPPCMTEVVHTDNGYLVGFSGTEIFVSERHEPHNWPLRYRLTLYDKIVRLLCVGDTVFALTTGHPYRIAVSPGLSNGQFDSTVDVFRMPHPYPCLQHMAATAAPFGVMYPSTQGIILIGITGPAQLYSVDRFDERLALEFRPTVAIYHQGRYYGAMSPSTNGFVLDVSEGNNDAVEFGDLTTIDWPSAPLAFHQGPDGRTRYIAADSRVYDIATGLRPRPYRWRSKRFVHSGQMRHTVAKVVGSYGPPVRFTIWVDGKQVFSKEATSSRPFRLPPLRRGLDWTFEIEGTTLVEEVHLATSFAELTEER